jgi:hypothetical protein
MVDLIPHRDSCPAERTETYTVDTSRPEQRIQGLVVDVTVPGPPATVARCCDCGEQVIDRG